MNTMDFAAKPIRNARGTYWMHELRTFFPYVINDRIGDGLKTIINTLMLQLNFHLD